MADPSETVGGAVSAAALQLGLGPSMAMDMVYLAHADATGLAMANAVAAQQRGQTLMDAALAQILVMIIAKGAKS